MNWQKKNPGNFLVLNYLSLPIENLSALVYWKGALLRYDFILATYTKTGIPISRQVIAGTSSDGKIFTKKLLRSIPDGDVDVILSHQIVDQRTFDASNTKEIYMIITQWLYQWIK